MKIHFLIILVIGTIGCKQNNNIKNSVTDHIKRYYSYDKIGMNISPREFRTIKGDLIQIGGEQSKPTMINLWFTRCRGCVQEIPALNELQKRYKRKVNFVAMTFDDATEVEKFLEKKKFKFHHITKARSMINEIGTKPYPENIFIDKFGNITHIERGLPYNENSDMDVVLEHFESIIEELLN